MGETLKPEDKEQIIFWKYQDQTKMKHKVFEEYFRCWCIILGKSHKLNYVDGFAGVGAYKEDNAEIIKFGSPLIAYSIISEICTKYNRNMDDCSILLFDTSKKNLKNISNLLVSQGCDLKKVKFYNDDFDSEINKILDRHQNIAPTFVLVDPFGFKIKLTTLKRIMSIKQSEILLNFMYDGIIRNLNVPQSETTLNELFGDSGWKDAVNLSSKEKEKFIIELFRRKLKKFSKFVKPFSFAFPDKDRTYYYLIHLTNDKKGCEIMASAFAKQNNGVCHYRGKLQQQHKLNDTFEFKNSIIQRFLLTLFCEDKKITYGELLDRSLDEIDYTLSDILYAIKDLESSNKIKIERLPPMTKTGKIRNSIQDQDIIQLIDK